MTSVSKSDALLLQPATNPLHSHARSEKWRQSPPSPAHTKDSTFSALPGTPTARLHALAASGGSHDGFLSGVGKIGRPGRAGTISQWRKQS
jgi:hypothetical protein